MNPLPLFLIIVTLPLLLGGCGEKKVPAAVNNPDLEGVNNSEIVRIFDIAYRKGSLTPYSGKSFQLDANGNKRAKANWKDGKYEGLLEAWNESGQKTFELNYKDGKLNGLGLEWHDNGTKKTNSNWKDGKHIDLVVKWHDNGQKHFEANYKYGGKKDGFVYT